MEGVLEVDGAEGCTTFNMSSIPLKNGQDDNFLFCIVYHNLKNGGGGSPSPGLEGKAAQWGGQNFGKPALFSHTCGSHGPRDRHATKAAMGTGGVAVEGGETSPHTQNFRPNGQKTNWEARYPNLDNNSSRGVKIMGDVLFFFFPSVFFKFLKETHTTLVIRNKVR